MPNGTKKSPLTDFFCVHINLQGSSLGNIISLGDVLCWYEIQTPVF